MANNFVPPADSVIADEALPPNRSTKKATRLPVLRIILWGLLILLGLFLLWIVFLSLRYSPRYMYRELFMNLGSVNDMDFFPQRELAASPRSFTFAVDSSREEEVQAAFQSNPQITDLDAFLDETGTWAFLVIQDDAILYERYFGEHQRDSLVTSKSVAKSFDSALIGIAIEDGYIKSVEDPITDYIPELAERDPRFRDIQIRHLLMMASGLRFEERPASLSDGSLTYAYDDLRHLALTETEIVEPPGVTFVYNDYNPILLGLILERATGQSVTAYLQEKIWNPLGMEYPGSWSLDSEASGFEMMSSGINARAVDFAKLGRLYLNGGDWNGEPIVPSEWVAQSLTDNGLIRGRPLNYGYLWWGKPCQPDTQDFFAWGDFGQFVYVSPARDLIITRNASEYGLEGEGEEWAGIFCQFAKALP